MKKEQLLGLIRELLMAGGAALASFGVVKEGFDALPAVGAVMALISLVWAISDKSGGAAQIGTLVRKALSAAGGAIAAYGLASPDQIGAVSAVLLPIVAMAWSNSTNGDGDQSAGRFPLWILALTPFFFALPSCTVSVDPTTGKPIVGVDGAAIGQIINDKAAAILEEK